MNEEKKVLLHCEHLVKEFPVSRTKSVHAVSDIDLEIYEGECLALVGESGCGKSTLGRTLIQLHKPTSGDVWYKDVKISAMKPAEFAPYRRQMQMIFQDPYASLDPRMNVRDIIAEPLVTYKVCENKEALTKRVLELMDAVGVPRDFLYRYPHQFSGGQRQRIESQEPLHCIRRLSSAMSRYPRWTYRYRARCSTCLKTFRHSTA